MSTITASAALQRVKGIKKSFDNASQEAISQYFNSRMFSIENTSEVQEIFTSTESLTGTKQLAELEAPPVNSLKDGYSVTLSANKFGNAIEVSETMMIESRDNTFKIDAYLQRERDRLIADVTNYFAVEIHKLYNESFSSTSAYLAPDGVETIGTHTWSTGTTFVNYDTQALDSDAVDTAMEFGGAFTDAGGQPMPQTYNHIVVKLGSAAHRQAVKLFAEGITPTAVADINIYEGGMFTIIATPHITTANKTKWWMLDLSRNPSPAYVGITQMPKLSEPIVQNNNAIRTNATAYWKQGINNMPFNVYGSTGTT